jgi:Icc-related predicted phosphoesterase
MLGKRKKTSRPRGHRIFFATDVHGSEACFRKFLNAREPFEVDDLILGGDIAGKYLVPVTRNGSGAFRLRYGDAEYTGEDSDELKRILRLIRDHGDYPYVASADEIAELSVDSSLRDAVFRRCVYQVASDWAELAEARLSGSGTRCFVAPGNDDFLEIDDALRGGSNVIFAENECLQLTETHEMITTGYSNRTPWETERELDEPVLGERIERMFAKVRNPAALVAVLHAPPYNSSIDQAPELDEDLRPSVKIGGGVLMAPVGSTAVRAFIEQRQPLLSLHGHVHEGLGSEKIGRTLCLNPGSEYASGVLSGAIAELDDEHVRSFQFISG